MRQVVRDPATVTYRLQEAEPGCSAVQTLLKTDANLAWLVAEP